MALYNCFDVAKCDHNFRISQQTSDVFCKSSIERRTGAKRSLRRNSLAMPATEIEECQKLACWIRLSDCRYKFHDTRGTNTRVIIYVQSANQKRRKSLDGCSSKLDVLLFRSSGTSFRTGSLLRLVFNYSHHHGIHFKFFCWWRERAR